MTVSGALAADRVARVGMLIRGSQEILRSAITSHVLNDNREVASIAVLFSGGNDSTVLLDLFRGIADVAVHANTGIGVEKTREFVRGLCAKWDIPLLEEHPPASYETLVMDQGFPGPAHHWKMYQRLKERCIEQARTKLNPNPYRYRVVFLAGRRRTESQRRKSSLITTVDRKGSMVFVSPLLNWTTEDMNTYRVLRNVPRNEVADLLHMSGECLCGAFAAEGEREELSFWFPEVAAQITALERRVQALKRHPPKVCIWGWGAQHGKGRRSKVGPLCSSCEVQS